MGGIKQHSKGIQITFYWNGERFRPTLKIPPTATNLKYADRLKGEIERAIGLRRYTLNAFTQHFPTSRIAQTVPKKQSKPTFKDISDLWLQASSHLSKGTLIKYKQALGFWLEHLADEPIDTIQFSTIAALANSQGWNAKNRNNILECWHALFFWCGLCDS